MSYKVYNGFKFKDKMTLDQIHKLCMKFRKIAKSIVYDEITIWKAKKAVEVFDQNTLNNPEKKEIPIHVAWSELNDRRRNIQKSGKRDPEIDFSFNISIIPYGKKFLGIYYAENKALINAWLNLLQIEEYGWSDQIDCPENPKGWAQRAKDWKRALGETSIPSMVGFSADMVEQFYPHVDVEDVVKKVPTLSKRAKDVAIDVLFNEYFEKRKSSLSDDLHELSGVYYDYKKWVQEEKDGKKALNEKIKEVKNKLKKRIGKSDLLGK